MKSFIQRVKTKAAQNPKRIVFPEGSDERILKAIPQILQEKTATPLLIGNPDELKAKAETLGLNLDWNTISVIDPKRDSRVPEFANEYETLRKGALTPEQALEEMQTDLNLLGTMMVHTGDADGMISGATCSTAHTIRPALRIIKTKERFHKVSGFFFMVFENRVLLFADCAVIIEPNSHELADITIDTAETALQFGITPRVAMLSFSTNGSAEHPNVDKVREATKMVKHRRPDLVVEGEMQVDAALVPGICQRKFPKADCQEDFNVMIFPNLGAGNIAYKLVQRLAGAHAIGPIFQGLNKPINDLSRGCSTEDVVDLTAFTVVEAQDEEAIF